MKAINTGNIYRLYDDSVYTYDQLPAQVYKVCFVMNQGFFLEQTFDLENKEKIYGIHEQKIEKVFKAFKTFDRNFGVILSGEKGIGKSLFAKLLAIKAVENGYPLIIVDSYIPGIADFINTIEQEVIVIFDEFDKTFAKRGENNEQGDPQAEMLSLFDGFSTGKKMFIITCNGVRSLNEYLINRPGRFHYHFRFGYPEETDIREFMSDKLQPSVFEASIGDIISFSKKVNLNYDCLRAIAFELNMGSSFKDAIADLNIVNVDKELFDLYLYLSNGTAATAKNVALDIFSGDEVDISFQYMGLWNAMECTFIPQDNVYDVATGGLLIQKEDLFDFSHLGQDCTEEEIKEDWSPRWQGVIKKMEGLEPVRLLIRHNYSNKEIHFAV